MADTTVLANHRQSPRRLPPPRPHASVLTDKTAAGLLSGLLQALHDEIRRADLVHPAAT